jgi:hypothetical protein
MPEKGNVAKKDAGLQNGEQYKNILTVDKSRYCERFA